MSGKVCTPYYLTEDSIHTKIVDDADAQSVNWLTRDQIESAPPNRMRLLLWSFVSFGLIVACYFRYLDGTYFSQDDFVWLFFSKFHPFPLEVFWTDSLCGQFFRPIGQIWWVSVHMLAGDWVLPYQLAFLSVHLLNCVLVGALANRLIGNGAASAAIPLFATSPIFASRISPYYCYIFDTLGFTFFLLAIYLEVVSVRRGRGYFHGAALIAAVAAYFTKEAYFTLPAALVLVMGVTSDHQWNWQDAFRSWRRLVMHFIVWTLALAWRHAIIGGVGGYGLARIESLQAFRSHLVERCMTLMGFMGWSLSPHLARWDSNDLLMVGIDAGVWLILLSWSWRNKLRPGIWWLLAWIVVTWSPSFLMTTYAPVSFYTPLVAPVLLLSAIAVHYPHGHWIVFFVTAYNAIWSTLYFAERSASVRDLVRQQQSLVKTFGDGNAGTRPGDRIMLLKGNLDLTPDPIIKYHSSANRRVVDVLFVNTKFPIAWVICNSSGPDRISPMTISPGFQTGEMAIGQLKAVPLSYREQWWQIVDHGPPFRFFSWRDAEWREIYPPRRAENP